MLVNVELNKYNDENAMKMRERLKDEPDIIANIDYRSKVNSMPPEQTGIYVDYGSMLSYEMVNRLSYENEYPILGNVIDFSDKKIGDLSPYGVCDTVEQVLELYKNDLENPDRMFCISFGAISKEDQPKDGGWRWHKWGPYIGTHEPQHEYLYNEQGIDQVLVYHIFEIPNNPQVVG